jgi:hypothetical protein
MNKKRPFIHISLYTHKRTSITRGATFIYQQLQAADLIDCYKGQLPSDSSPETPKAEHFRLFTSLHHPLALFKTFSKLFFYHRHNIIIQLLIL